MKALPMLFVFTVTLCAAGCSEKPKDLKPLYKAKIIKDFNPVAETVATYRCRGVGMPVMAQLGLQDAQVLEAFCTNDPNRDGFCYYVRFEMNSARLKRWLESGAWYRQAHDPSDPRIKLIHNIPQADVYAEVVEDLDQRLSDALLQRIRLSQACYSRGAYVSLYVENPANPTVIGHIICGQCLETPSQYSELWAARK